MDMDKLKRATEAASLAVEFDKTKNNVDNAIECYETAASSLISYLENNYSEVPPDIRESYEANIKGYINRAKVLKNEKIMKELNQKLQLALASDAAARTEEAIRYYVEVIEIASKNKLDKSDDSKIKNIIRQSLERAEMLKGITQKDKSCANITQNPVALVPLVNKSNTKLSNGESYTAEEIQVLKHTSNINNNTYLPFMELDLKEKFQYNMTGVFEDPQGTLTLASKQIREFDKWIRPEQLCQGIGEPKMIAGPTVDYNAVKQTIISDCSFIASLTVSAQYEEKYNKKIITSIIYPRNNRDEPIYNPYGKYMIILHINGIRRKIIIDDRLPYSKYGNLLCSYSSKRTEFWVSLLEKAYMKVMGGYDFPGSNSNTDLHALTGWIPERCPIQRDDTTFNSEELFVKILNNYESGRILVTAATGPLDSATEDRTGLAASHAYSVLDVRQVLGKKLLKLKNPWSHTEWKGNYSDNSSLWTQELRDALRVTSTDDGLFWIDYRSILEFFDVFYLNWNPELFPHKYCLHEKWDANTGPAKDLYNISENPQYSLEVTGNGEVWLLLTRHITRIEDFRDNQEYITLLVYKSNGRRVYYPHDPPPYINGVRINSPHYLIKLKSTESTLYTLVMSQYEKTTTIYYTLRAFGTCAFQLKKLHIYPELRKIQGEWTQTTAGGCENHPATYNNNPKYIITVPDGRKACNLVIELKGPRQYQIGFSVKVLSLDDATVTAPFHTKSSGNYRSGYVVLDLPGLPAGKYIVTVATFTPGQLGHFFLDIRATGKITVNIANQ